MTEKEKKKKGGTERRDRPGEAAAAAAAEGGGGGGKSEGGSAPDLSKDETNGGDGDGAAAAAATTIGTEKTRSTPDAAPSGRKRRLSKRERRALKKKRRRRTSDAAADGAADAAGTEAAKPKEGVVARSKEDGGGASETDGGVAGTTDGKGNDVAEPIEKKKKKRNKKKRKRRRKAPDDDDSAGDEDGSDGRPNGGAAGGRREAAREETKREEKTEEEYLSNYVPIPGPEKGATEAPAGGCGDADGGGGGGARKLGRWFPDAVVIKTRTASNAAPPDSKVGRKAKRRRRKHAASDSASQQDNGDSGSGGGAEDASQRRPPPRASLVLFYQYVDPHFSPERVEALTEYLKRVAAARNLGGRIRVAAEGLNATVSSIDSFGDDDAGADAADADSDDDGEGEDRGEDEREKKDKSWKPRSAAENLRHFAEDLRRFDSDRQSFGPTDFKYIDDLPPDRHFKELKILPVKELVFYGIDEKDAPLNRGGVHLDAPAYHEMLGRDDAVVIDVRNHYEAAIGRFDGQQQRRRRKERQHEKKKEIESDQKEVSKDDGKSDGKGNSKTEEGEAKGGGSNEGGGAEYLDPLMRKSTDFPAWLSKPETKSKLEGKTVLMYCTGGVRCERASAYLKTKMGDDVKGVYQLKGGIERYLKEFPDGGYWRGKNFVFDKREAVGAEDAAGDGGVIRKKREKPLKKEKKKKSEKKDAASSTAPKSEAAATDASDGARCCVCSSPWDRYVGKKKCHTCGVPVLMCDSCMSERPDRTPGRELEVRCPLCKDEGVTVPADEVEYTANGVRGCMVVGAEGKRPQVDGEDGDSPGKPRGKKAGGTKAAVAAATAERKAAPSVLKWGGGHAHRKKELRKLGRMPCRFGAECARKDCFFAHPERRQVKWTDPSRAFVTRS